MLEDKSNRSSQSRDSVGKSNSVYNLGAGMTMKKKRVLLVDVDPQGDLADLLTSVDELFTTQEISEVAKLERVIGLLSDEISDFSDHLFKVRMGKEMI